MILADDPTLQPWAIFTKAVIIVTVAAIGSYVRRRRRFRAEDDAPSEEPASASIAPIVAYVRHQREVRARIGRRGEQRSDRGRANG